MRQTSGYTIANPYGGLYIFVRRLAVLLVASVLFVFASGIYAGKPAYADDALPYEIRATIITQEQYKGLSLSTPGFYGWGAEHYSFTQKNLVSSKQLENNLNEYKVVYQVDKAAPENHREGETVRYRLENDEYEFGDFQELTIKKDDKKGVYYADFTFKESLYTSKPLSLIDEHNTSIILKKDIENFPITLNGIEDTATISATEDKSGNEIGIGVEPNDDGTITASIELSQKAVGTIVTINDAKYIVQSVEKQNDGFIVHVKKIETVTKDVTFTLKRPYALAQMPGTLWKISTGCETKTVKIDVPEGRDDITFIQRITYIKDNPTITLTLQKFPGVGAMPWAGATDIVKQTFDEAKGTYTATLARLMQIQVITVNDTLTYNGVVKASLVKNLNLTLTDDNGNNVDTKAEVTTDIHGISTYTLHNILPGTYKLSLSTTDDATRKAYNLSGDYRITFKDDGTLLMNHLGDGEQASYYAAGASTDAVVGKTTLAGTKTKFIIALGHNPTFTKSVRVAARDANNQNKFATSVYANVGDTVEFDITVNLPRDYNILCKFGSFCSFGLKRPFICTDTIDPRLKIDEASIRVVDKDGKTPDKITAAYDTNARSITCKDGRDMLVKDPYNPKDIMASLDKPFGLRAEEEVLHLRFSAMISSFKHEGSNTEEAIQNIIADSKTTILPYKKLTVKKLWQDASGKELTQLPSAIYVQLLANGTPQGDCVLLNKDGKWQHEFINLPSKDKDGKGIVYTAVELTKKDGTIVHEKETVTVENQKFVAGYACKDNVVTITNKQQPAPTPTPEPPAPEPTPEPSAPEPTPEPSAPAPAPAEPAPAQPAPAPAEPAPAQQKPEPAAPQQAPQRKAIPQTSDATTPMQTQAGALAVIALLLCAFGTAYRVRRSA